MLDLTVRFSQKAEYGNKDITSFNVKEFSNYKYLVRDNSLIILIDKDSVFEGKPNSELSIFTPTKSNTLDILKSFIESNKKLTLTSIDENGAEGLKKLGLDTIGISTKSDYTKRLTSNFDFVFDILNSIIVSDKDSKITIYKSGYINYEPTIKKELILDSNETGEGLQLFNLIVYFGRLFGFKFKPEDLDPLSQSVEY